MRKWLMCLPDIHNTAASVEVKCIMYDICKKGIAIRIKNHSIGSFVSQ